MASPLQGGDPADLLDWLNLVGIDPTVVDTKTGRLMTCLRYT